MASQLKTVVFGLFYFSIGVLMFLRYLKNENFWWLSLSALLFFFAYGSHITYIVFMIAPIMVLAINLKHYRATMLFVSIIAFMLCGELLLTSSMFSNVSEVIEGGRLGYIFSGTTHLPVTKVRARGEDLQYLDLIIRWRWLPKFEFFVFLGYLISSIALLRRQIREVMPVGIWLFFYAAGAYGFAVTFPIVDVEPLRLAMALHTRYLAPVFPLAMVFLVWIFRYACISYTKVVNEIQILLSVALVVVFCVGSNTYNCLAELSSNSYSNKVETGYCHFFRYSQNQNIYPAPDSFIFDAQKYYGAFVQDYLAGRVSLTGSTRIDILEQIIRISTDRAQFLNTPNGSYIMVKGQMQPARAVSVDGDDNEWCLTELGQTQVPQQNYRFCAPQKK